MWEKKCLVNGCLHMYSVVTKVISGGHFGWLILHSEGGSTVKQKERDPPPSNQSKTKQSKQTYKQKSRWNIYRLFCWGWGWGNCQALYKIYIYSFSNSLTLPLVHEHSPMFYFCCRNLRWLRINDKLSGSFSETNCISGASHCLNMSIFLCTDIVQVLQVILITKPLCTILLLFTWWPHVGHSYYSHSWVTPAHVQSKNVERTFIVLNFIYIAQYCNDLYCQQ